MHKLIPLDRTAAPSPRHRPKPIIRTAAARRHTVVFLISTHWDHAGGPAVSAVGTGKFLVLAHLHKGGRILDQILGIYLQTPGGVERAVHIPGSRVGDFLILDHSTVLSNRRFQRIIVEDDREGCVGKQLISFLGFGAQNDTRSIGGHTLMGLRQGVIELLHALAGRVGKGEKLLCDGIAEDLELEKYTVEQCYDGAKAYDLLLNEAFDLLILDLNLPGMDGLDLLRVARAEWPQLRVLILSARAGLSDRITGLDLGADDYLTKPFALEELEARVRSLLRREFVSRDTALTTAGLTLDTRSRSISAGGEPGASGADTPGIRHFGAPDAPSEPLGQPGGADGACVGIERQSLQQCSPNAHLLPAEKAAGGPERRSHPNKGGTGLSFNGGFRTMKWAHSLRLRVTLWCALLLTLCCTALAVTSNLSAIQLADSIAAVPLYPAQTAPGLDAEMPLTLVSPPAPAVQQARQLFTERRSRVPHPDGRSQDPDWPIP